MISTDIAEAAARLAAGGLVAIPTETVYGLAANAEDDAAVARIFAVKQRPTDHPLIVHLAASEADTVDFGGWAGVVAPGARILAEACWPGPLTMLVGAGPRVHRVVTGGRPTVGLRVPAHPLTQDLLERTGFGLAAPSANRFGRVSPTSAEHVAVDLDGVLDDRRDLILDGGPSAIGVESTIVDLTVEPPQILRSGAIGDDEIGRLLDTTVDAASGPSRAAGMLASHYAPNARVVLADDRHQADDLLAAERQAGREVAVLDRTDDLVVAAQRLYSDLRDADRHGVETLIVVLPEATGLGIALRDRLTKASADRPSPTG